MRRTRSIGASLVFFFVAMVPVPAHAADVEVAIQDFVFSPDQATVISGNVVRWTHMGANPHTVNADDGSFDSNPIPATSMTFGQTFSVTFTGPARTVRYYCEIHGAPNGVGMAGTVIVVPPLKPPANFDGDADSDISVIRPPGNWFVKDGLSLSWGAAGDIAVPATYDADSTTDVAVFRPDTGLWAVRNSSGGETFLTYGVSSDVPVPADYDGDGRSDIAIYRPSLGTWWVRQSSTGTDVATTFGGIAGDIPVVGDYDGDGKSDRAIFRAGVWHVRPASGPDTATSYGAAGDIPVPGRWDSDAKTDVAIYRPATGLWSIRNSTTGTDTARTYGGIAGDEPVPGDYDGDNKTDVGIFRQSSAAWFVRKSSTNSDDVSTFGVSSDVPLLLPAAIRSAFY